MTAILNEILYAVDEAQNALDLVADDSYPGGVVRLDSVFRTMGELRGHVKTAFRNQPKEDPTGENGKRQIDAHLDFVMLVQKLQYEPLQWYLRAMREPPDPPPTAALVREWNAGAAAYHAGYMEDALALMEWVFNNLDLPVAVFDRLDSAIDLLIGWLNDLAQAHDAIDTTTRRTTKGRTGL